MNEKRQQLAREALQRAEGGESAANYETIYNGFTEKGIAEENILPRENIFTYNAWLAKGRQVRRGEKGIKIPVRIGFKQEDEEGNEKRRSMRKYTTVFHISQTDKVARAGDEEEE